MPDYEIPLKYQRTGTIQTKRLAMRSALERLWIYCVVRLVACLPSHFLIKAVNHKLPEPPAKVAWKSLLSRAHAKGVNEGFQLGKESK